MVCATVLVILLGSVILIEMMYHLTLESANGTTMKLFGNLVDTALPGVWLIGAGLLLAGIVSFIFARRPFNVLWGEVNTEIEQLVQRGGK